MRRSRRDCGRAPGHNGIRLGAALAVAAAVATALGLGAAQVGRAAGTGICPTPSACIHELVLPHVLTAGQSALSITKFESQSSSTATHVLLGASFADSTGNPVAFGIVNVRVRVNDQPATASCTAGSPTGPAIAVGAQGAVSGVTTTAVFCSLGNLAGFGSAKLTLQITPPLASATYAVTGSVLFGEAGSDNPTGPNGTSNDTPTAQDTLVVRTSANPTAAGRCTTVAAGATETITAGGAELTSSVTYPGTSETELPCTPAGTAILPPLLTTDTASVEVVPLLTPGWATVTLDFLVIEPPLTTQNFVLYEFTDAGVLVGAVPPCARSGAPPSGDSCIVKKKGLSRGGLEFTLHVLGSLVDPRYGG